MVKVSKSDMYLKYAQCDYRGQRIIPFVNGTYVLIDNDWYRIDQPHSMIQFPVTNKEYRIKNILKQVDEID